MMPLRRLACLCAALAALASVGTGLAGCGQKGPLYLPGESTEPVEPGIPAEQTGRSAPDEEQEEEAAGER